jgi:uncharacterized protein YcgL (UPF0745 family)
MSQGVMFHIRENLSSADLRLLTQRIEREQGFDLQLSLSRKPHLHFIASETSPHVVLNAIREQGYHACLVDL